MIYGFQGEYRFLSNFYPCKVEMGGDTYRTVEHAYQAAKTLDPAERATFRELAWPNAAKSRGRLVVLRKDWDKVKVRIMHQLLRRKFKGNADLCMALLKTHPQPLVEYNNWGDVFWGVTLANGGENKLGELLMAVRTELNPF